LETCYVQEIEENQNENSRYAKGVKEAKLKIAARKR